MLQSISILSNIVKTVNSATQYWTLSLSVKSVGTVSQYLTISQGVESVDTAPKYCTLILSLESVVTVLQTNCGKCELGFKILHTKSHSGKCGQ